MTTSHIKTTRDLDLSEDLIQYNKELYELDERYNATHTGSVPIYSTDSCIDQERVTTIQFGQTGNLSRFGNCFKAKSEGVSDASQLIPLDQTPLPYLYLDPESFPEYFNNAELNDFIINLIPVFENEVEQMVDLLLNRLQTPDESALERQVNKENASFMTVFEMLFGTSVLLNNDLLGKAQLHHDYLKAALRDSNTNVADVNGEDFNLKALSSEQRSKIEAGAFSDVETLDQYAQKIISPRSYDPNQISWQKHFFGEECSICSLAAVLKDDERATIKDLILIYLRAASQIGPHQSEYKERFASQMREGHEVPSISLQSSEARDPLPPVVRLPLSEEYQNGTLIFDPMRSIINHEYRTLEQRSDDWLDPEVVKAESSKEIYHTKDGQLQIYRGFVVGKQGELSLLHSLQRVDDDTLEVLDTMPLSDEEAGLYLDPQIISKTMHNNEVNRFLYGVLPVMYYEADQLAFALADAKKDFNPKALKKELNKSSPSLVKVFEMLFDTQKLNEKRLLDLAQLHVDYFKEVYRLAGSGVNDFYGTPFSVSFSDSPDTTSIINYENWAEALFGGDDYFAFCEGGTNLQRAVDFIILYLNEKSKIGDPEGEVLRSTFHQDWRPILSDLYYKSKFEEDSDSVEHQLANERLPFVEPKEQAQEESEELASTTTPAVSAVKEPVRETIEAPRVESTMDLSTAVRARIPQAGDQTCEIELPAGKIVANVSFYWGNADRGFEQQGRLLIITEDIPDMHLAIMKYNVEFSDQSMGVYSSKPISGNLVIPDDM